MSIFGIANNFDLLTVGIAIAATVILGSITYLSNKQSITNRTFFYFTLTATFWGVVNYLNYQFASAIAVLWLLRLVIFFAVWYSFFLFQFFYVFPQEKIIFPKWYKLLLLPVVIITSIINLTSLVFKGIAELAPVGQVSKVIHGPGIFLFTFIVISLITSAFFLLIRKILKVGKLERLQYRFIGLGLLFTFSLHMIFNLILPAFFDNRRFIPLGAVFTFPFALLTSYSIIRHKLFNIRVAGAAVLVFALSMVSFIEVTQADNLILIIYRSSVLFFVLVFGILLIRSVMKEVKQREEIAAMAEDVRRAYVIEKRAKEELAKLDKVKDQFLMTTQHNLRTPLTSMMGYSDLLLKGSFGKQNKKTTEVIQRFQSSTQSLIRMVNNFLDMAQFQLGKSVITLKPDVQVGPILDEIVNDLKFKAESKGIYLKLEKPKKIFTIKADREKLKAALFNIIDNAVKYTEKGGVGIKAQNHDTVKIIVSDTGIGIAKDKIHNMFSEMFERSEEAKRISSVGSGVGLYLSYQIIKSHNGKVWVTSEGEGKGSTFYIELPLSTNN